MFNKMKIRKAMANQNLLIAGKLKWLSTHGKGPCKIVNYVDELNNVYIIHEGGRIEKFDIDQQIRHYKAPRFK